jgi:4a-hydroxytetrahydrobiopterin dehydratase
MIVLGAGGIRLHTQSPSGIKSVSKGMFLYLALTTTAVWIKNRTEIGEKTPMSQLLVSEGVRTLLGELPGWKLIGDRIERVVEFDRFTQAIEFVNRLATLAEELNHHPDIDIRWNKVRLVSSTHSAGGLTEKDFTLARKINQLI